MICTYEEGSGEDYCDEGDIIIVKKRKGIFKMGAFLPIQYKIRSKSFNFSISILPLICKHEACDVCDGEIIYISSFFIHLCRLDFERSFHFEGGV